MHHALSKKYWSKFIITSRYYATTATKQAIKPSQIDNPILITNNDDMSSLKNAVHSTLANLLSTRLSDHGDIAADVYRTLRDEAALLLERQFISDALDVDPFELTRSSGGSSPTGEGDDENAEADNDEEKSNGGDDEEDLLEKKKNAGVIARVKVSIFLMERVMLVSPLNALFQL